MYSVLRPLLFALDPETSHDLSLDCLGAAERLKLLSLCKPNMAKNPVELWGLRFSNPIGLAAGLDKNGDYFNALGQFGFGFVEIGTVTPLPQSGNPKPRMFRLQSHEAIINRMGFNNKGVAYLVEQVKKRRYDGILGINIGKNKLTPESQALNDYVIGMEAVYAHADYITVNISSPNTPGLRDLQFGKSLEELLAGIKTKQLSLKDAQGRYVPVLIKIAPDMTEEEVASVSKIFLAHDVDGVIATNTTIDRDRVEDSPHGHEMGGLSGAPLLDKSTRMITLLRQHLGNAMPIIGVGGITQGSDAVQKLTAGANLVQLYSGFIYKGPRLVQECRQAVMDYQALQAHTSS